LTFIVDALDVHGVEPVEVFLGRLLHVADVCDPGAVDEDVDRGEPLRDRLEGVFHVGLPAHIARDRGGCAAAGLDLARHVARRRLRDVQHGDAPAGAREAEGDRPADPRPSTGHDRDLVLDLPHNP